MRSSASRLAFVVGWTTLICIASACAAPPASSKLRWSAFATVERPAPEDLLGLFERGAATCGVDRDGALLCWIAYGDPTALRFDSAHASITSVVFADHLGEVGCVLDSGHRIWCWDDFEQLFMGLHAIVGLGSRHVPVELVLSERHGCARLDNGRVACWGHNFAGQLGRDINERCEAADERAPDEARVVPDVRDVIDLAAGEAFTCTAHRDGSVRCWGRLDLGGSGCQPPQVVAGLDSIVAIAADSQVGCALDRDGVVSCWGSEYDEDPSWEPCRIPLSRPAVAIAVDFAAGWVRATLDDGRVMQWRPHSACAGEGVTIEARD
jgi:hypothetical protein